MLTEKHTPFLQQVAHTFLQHESMDELLNNTFIFPSRRAGRFFAHYLCKEAESTILAPKIITIDDLFGAVSPLLVADKITLLFLLYEAYKEVSVTENQHLTGINDFDEFAPWGEAILNDFGDIDNYLKDAKMVLTNATQWHDFDDEGNFLTEEQRSILQQYWISFGAERSQTNKTLIVNSFVSLWNVLYSLYLRFREKLTERGWAYNGMLRRNVIENHEQDTSLFDNFGHMIFVGFNALNPTDLKLMELLKKSGKADFYWDYPAPVLQEPEDKNPAAYFKDNAIKFPSKYHLPFNHDDEEIAFNDKEISVIGIPSQTGMSKTIGNLLEKENAAHIDKTLSTAVVLPDESLLLPLLYAIPSSIEHINITMGYPSKFTPLQTLIESIQTLERTQRNGKLYYKPVISILNHPYVEEKFRKICIATRRYIQKDNLIFINPSDLCNHLTNTPKCGNIEWLRKIFSLPCESATIETWIDYLRDCILGLISPTTLSSEESDSEFEQANFSRKMKHVVAFHYLEELNRIADVIKPWRDEMSVQTLFRFLKNSMGRDSVPFEGDPLCGLQVMGLLETRNLDFETLYIPSMNEGDLPKTSVNPTFIPYSLRVGYGLPTVEHQDRIFSYHFFRLICRARKVVLLHVLGVEDGDKLEESRYIKQLEYLYQNQLKSWTRIEQSYNLHTQSIEKFCIQKTDSVMKKLDNFTTDGNKNLSPSALKTYINCPLKFYWRYVEGLKKSDDDDLSDGVEDNVFGTLFHACMQILYKDQTDITQELMESLCSETTINAVIDHVMTEHLFKKDSSSEFRGESLIVKGILFKYIKQTLNIDKGRVPFRYIASEKEIKWTEDISSNKTIRFIGTIDRIDQKDGIHRIIDYKTGMFNEERKRLKSIDECFSPSEKNSKHEIMQTLCYAKQYQKETGLSEDCIEPHLFFLQDAMKNNDKFSSHIINSEKANICLSDVRSEFEEGLRHLLEEIFDAEIPFAAPQETNCNFCDFTEICGDYTPSQK